MQSHTITKGMNDQASIAPVVLNLPSRNPHPESNNVIIKAARILWLIARS